MFQTLGELRQEIRQVIDPLIFRLRKGLNLVSGAVVSIKNDLDEYPESEDIVTLVSGKIPEDQIPDRYIQWSSFWSDEGDYVLKTAGIDPIRASPSNLTIEAPYSKIHLKNWLHYPHTVTTSGNVTIGSGTVNVWGTPIQGNVPVWNESLGWWVPSTVSGGVGGSVDWVNVLNKPTNIVYINDTPALGESIVWDGSQWIAMFNDWTSITNIPSNIVYINDTPVSGESIVWDGSQWVAQYLIGGGSVEWSNILNKPTTFVYSSDTPVSGEVLKWDGSEWIASSIEWSEVLNKPANIVTTNDTPLDQEVLRWNSSSGEWVSDTLPDYVVVSGSPSDGDSIVWESSSSSWIVTPISGGGGTGGDHASTHEDGGSDLISRLSSVTINASGSSTPGLIVNSHSSADLTTILQEWTDSSGSPVARLMSNGTFYCLNVVIGAIVPFDPMNLNPVAYWDITESTFDIVDTNRVSAWYDASGNNVTMNEGASNRRPIKHNDYIEFEAGDYLNAGDVDLWSNTNGLTIFIVVDPDNTGSLLSHYYAGGGQRAYIARTAYWNVQENHYVFNSGTVANIYAVYNLNLMTYLWEPGVRGPVYRNGTFLNNIGVVNDLSSSYSLLMGRDGDGSWFDGKIYSIIVYDYALDDLNRSKVEDYLIDKYSITT